MSALADVASALGVPAWGATVSTGIVVLAGYAEKSMREEARAQIGRFLDHGSIPAEAPGITHAVRAAFVATFGERHWGWRCLSRTVVLSLLTTYAITLLIWFKHGAEIRARLPGLPSVPVMIASTLIGVVLFALLLNYALVGKTRLILRGMSKVRGLGALLAFMLADVLLTYLFNMVLYWGPILATTGTSELCDTMRYYDPEADCSALGSPAGVASGILGVTGAMTERIWSHAGTLTPGNILNYAEGCATFLTSIWAVLIVLALALLRLLAPVARLRRLIKWGWDVQKTPVLALGWMVAVLVFSGAVVYAMI